MAGSRGTGRKRAATGRGAGKSRRINTREMDLEAALKASAEEAARADKLESVRAKEAKARREARKRVRSEGLHVVTPATLAGEMASATGRFRLYYMRQMGLILEHVVPTWMHVLSPAEVDIARKFVTGLTSPAQRLFVRLYLRKGPWFTLNACMQYSELVLPPPADDGLVDALAVQAAVEAAGAELEDAGFALKDFAGEASVDELIGARSRVELEAFVVEALGAGPSLARSEKRAGLEAMVRREAHARDLLVAHRSQPEWVIRLAPEVTAVFDLCQFLFQLRDARDRDAMTSLTLMAMRQARFAHLPLEPLPTSVPVRGRSAVVMDDDGKARSASGASAARAIFPTRHALDAFMALQASVASVDGAKTMTPDLAALVEASQLWLEAHAGRFARKHSGPPPFALRYTAGWQHARLLTYGTRVLEREGRYRDAVAALRLLLSLNGLCVHRRGEWWERLATDLVHLKRPQEALDAAVAGLAERWVVFGHRFALQKRVASLAKPPLVYSAARLASVRAHFEELAEPSTRTIVGELVGGGAGWSGRNVWAAGPTSDVPGAHVSVEQVALDWYAAKLGYVGRHDEGTLLRLVFVLVLYDALFASVDGVFVTAAQDAPLDTRDAHFYARRADVIEAALEQVSRLGGEELGAHLAVAYAAHEGKCVRGAAWESVSVDEVVGFGRAARGPALASLLRAMAKHRGRALSAR
ncbi:uncharacterized protein AMSG_03676 [Thecamonas trahens ATCC 50062]|uniref:Fanconi-associated nuclease n=1 Tax=Thecamonas trahens ATCC 50062 TaxID=461836 RepID=A0A0L0D4F4_THETB|nr:hypothetical protein AMSG_03676 [Thecamonas trahens ATCC 50062]KNC47247.1 hypothetical protein AMSG_03676 [Thecamonas trahens ATCC 50062]|eukprot:XP_013759590.1 hypothetical protein AMSG_03676 [Thecamonas trahens ATCC 50062]